jgi:hypothetical protein
MPARMEGRGRIVLTAAVVILVLGVPVAALFASGGGDEDPRRPPASRPGLRLEASTRALELLVYVESRANTPERAGGARSVRLTCVDPGGHPVVAKDEAWPFTDTDGGTIDPHTHVTLDAGTLDQVESCRLEGTDPPLEGTLP